MPLYEYDCLHCGVFSTMGAIATYDAPASCSVCGASSSRAPVAAPAIRPNRTAAARAPTGRSTLTYRRGGHGPACPCCKPLARKVKK